MSKKPLCVFVEDIGEDLHCKYRINKRYDDEGGPRQHGVHDDSEV